MSILHWYWLLWIVFTHQLVNLVISHPLSQSFQAHFDLDTQTSVGNVAFCFMFFLLLANGTTATRVTFLHLQPFGSINFANAS